MADDHPADSTISAQWQRQIAIYRELAHKADLHADLVDTIDPRWRGRIEVQNGGSQIRFLPLGDSLNHGRCLWVAVKARWTLKLTSKEPSEIPVVLKRRVVPFERGPAALDEFLGAMFDGREPSSVTQGTRTWDDLVDSFGRSSYAGRIKAELLESVDPKWTHVSEANDNGRRLEIQRLGDTPTDGLKLNIRFEGDRYLFELRHQESTGRDDVLREAEATMAEAPPLLDEFLSTMLSDRILRGQTVRETAQDVFKTMLRQQIAPALRKMGFKGSGNNYEMARDEYRIQIQLQRSTWSTRDSVQFDANVSVFHLPTRVLFNEENRKARQLGKAMEGTEQVFHPRLSQMARPNTSEFAWIVRPDEPSEPVANDFVECVRLYFLPVVEEEMQRPLPSPTPLNQRADHTYKSAMYFLGRMGLDAASQVRGALDAGDTHDQVARALVVDQQIGPIEAIKAHRNGGDMPLGRAKEIVHRTLPPDRQAAAERLWDDAVEALEEFAEEPEEN
jgi:Domain of unknown function (DUF4304)